MVAAGLGTGRSFVGAGRTRPPPNARRGEDAVHGRRSKEKEGRGRPWLHTRTQRRVREGGIKQKLGFLLSDFGRGVGVHWLHRARAAAATLELYSSVKGLHVRRSHVCALLEPRLGVWKAAPVAELADKLRRTQWWNRCTEL